MPRRVLRCRVKRAGGGRGGFVLVTTLVLMLLAAMLLAGLARQSLSIAAAADDAQQQLQRRWGVFSLRMAILTHPQEILAEYQRAHAKTPEEARQLYPLMATVRLGLALNDECRKLNVNRLYLTAGTDAVRQVMIELEQGARLVRLQPHPDDPRKSSLRPFEGWGEVYALEELSSKLSLPEWIATNTGGVTCWGGGNIQYAVAGDQVLELVARRAVGPVVASRLIDLRHRNPKETLEKLLDQLAIRQSEKDGLRSWLTDRSDCFSLWIEAAGPERSWWELAVSEVTSNGSQQLYRFIW